MTDAVANDVCVSVCLYARISVCMPVCMSVWTLMNDAVTITLSCLDGDLAAGSSARHHTFSKWQSSNTVKLCSKGFHGTVKILPTD